MKAVVRTIPSLFLVLFFNIFLVAQKQAAPEPPQTPRQALIEIIKGDSKALMKHLTVEVQELLGKPDYAAGLLGSSVGFGNWTRRAGAEVNTFDNGLVLLSVNDPKALQKFEIHVDTEAMSGDSDTMELSFHTFYDGAEQQQEWQPILSRFAVTLVMQNKIWRLSKLEAGAQFLIGDPEFLKKTVLKSFDEAAKMAKSKERINMENDGEPSPRTEVSGEEMLQTLGYAEQAYARQHPDVGFTCSLAQLAEVGKGFGIDPQMATGVSGGYKIDLTGCQGHPAGSFQITAEPLKGGKAYCTDATHNVRMSDDGRVFTCLTAGRISRPVQSGEEEEESKGEGDSMPAPPPKPNEQ